MSPTGSDALSGSDAGVPLPDAGADTAAHPLVTVGDSLMHGMSSGAVSRGELAWPGMVADCLGVDLPGPAYGGPLGGLPFNIEGLLRRLQDKFGDRLNPLEMTACRKQQVSPRPGSPRRRPTTTCSGPSRPTTATSPRAPSSARSDRRRPRSTPPAGSAPTAASAR